jgi:hypothetical protein
MAGVGEGGAGDLSRLELRRKTLSSSSFFFFKVDASAEVFSFKKKLC